MRQEEMESAGQHGDGTADSVTSTDSAVDRIKEAEGVVERSLAGLRELDGLPVSEHVARFDAVHDALTDALNRADELLSGPSSSGS
ncbi:hypothetical protein ACOQFL_07575 [Actinopolyspora sp. H202]|uniref:hypothetical protein n=1 Tax=Actinopolyspora sp. H202 TaxID=1500456 RepID=UPI003EE7908F